MYYALLQGIYPRVRGFRAGKKTKKSHGVKSVITDVVSVLRRLLDKLIPYPRVGYTDHDIMVPGYLVDLCYQNIGKGASKYHFFLNLCLVPVPMGRLPVGVNWG